MICLQILDSQMTTQTLQKAIYGVQKILPIF